MTQLNNRPYCSPLWGCVDLNETKARLLLGTTTLAHAQ